VTPGRLVAIVGGAAALVLIAVLVAGASSGDTSSGDASSGDSTLGKTAVRAQVPAAGVSLQSELGALPEPAGASRVDLAKPSLLSGFRLKAPSAGLAFDLADGSVLWRRNATRRHPIASLTKMMTGLLAVERLAPGDRVRITRGADRVGGSRMGGLRVGRTVPAEILLKGLIISSSNDAAVALAVAGAGSERAWVRLMNRRARLLGLRCTKYVDPHGLNPRDRSCPADLAVLAMRAMAEPRIARIARKRQARVWPGSGKKLTLRTTNHLLRERYAGAIGLKTGFTNAAGRCLVAVIQRGSQRIGIVLLHDRNPWQSARRITHAAVRAGVFPRA